MKGSKGIQAEQEPVGIVISRGWEPEPAPMFAYMWAPAPEPDAEPKSKVA